MIKNIAIHHAGGIASNAYASSLHLTHHQINEAHRARWNFMSQHIPGQYGGYNFVYDPKDRSFHQFRAIGEETAAQKGYNFDTVSICIIGNYSIQPHTTLPVDRMTETIEKDIAQFVYKLIDGTHGKKVAPGVQIDLSITRAHPHRYYQQGTECYGMALNDSWISQILAKYKMNPNTSELEKRAVLQKKLIQLYLKLQALLQQKEAMRRSLGAFYDSEHACEGMIDQTY